MASLRREIVRERAGRVKGPLAGSPPPAPLTCPARSLWSGNYRSDHNPFSVRCEICGAASASCPNGQCNASKAARNKHPKIDGLTGLSTREYDFRVQPFGQILRELRMRSGTGIKRLAPELSITYSYLSKLENGEVAPSEELVARIARYFHYDTDRLLISAGKIPKEVLSILQEHPDEALDFLRERFGRGAK